MRETGSGERDRERDGGRELVSWCFEPNQPQRRKRKIWTEAYFSSCPYELIVVLKAKMSLDICLVPALRFIYLLYMTKFDFFFHLACIPRGFTFTWWGCYCLCLWHKPTELVHSFVIGSCVCFCLYGPFNHILFHLSYCVFSSLISACWSF